MKTRLEWSEIEPFYDTHETDMIETFAVYPGETWVDKLTIENMCDVLGTTPDEYRRSKEYCALSGHKEMIDVLWFEIRIWILIADDILGALGL